MWIVFKLCKKPSIGSRVTRNFAIGFMSAYSTKLYREEINSVTDLQNLKYSIYSEPYLVKVFGFDLWTDTQKKYVQFHVNDPCDNLINAIDSRSACFTSMRDFQWGLDHNMHILLFSSQLFYSPGICNDWPLKPRVDHVMSQLSAGGFIRLWNNRRRQ
ncbi:hypothetical protein KQX54_000708 [Cotesia glomerata]|uniref:Uncharacterized protein n=1 Tax=Cotesia glomerata TaxID=32391 RepID=A0AAV7IK69_COTGL|nr:hypothetical protein KQX54_000708 [Cotesia glomerata]